MTYIGFEKNLNLTNPPTADVYDFMAGGLFDGYYAGGYAYNALILPGADLRSFFINQSFSITAGLLEFNEDFCEFVLMPMQIMLLNERENVRLDTIVKESKRLLGIKNSIKERSKNERYKELLAPKGGVSSAGFYKEILADFILENAAEELGRAILGPVGAMIGGAVYDGIVNNGFEGANVAEAVYAELKKLAIDTFAKSVLKTIGLNAGGVIGVSLISTLINEVFELATGLDISFGFGGDLAAVNELGQGIYTAPLGFGEGIKNMSGFSNGEYLISSKSDYLKSGRIEGFKNKSGIYIGQIGDDLTADRRSKKEIEATEKEALSTAKEMFKEYENSKEYGGHTGSERDRDHDSSKGDWGGFNDGTGATGGMLA